MPSALRGGGQDLWAVGVTLYLWVSGRMPFAAPTTMLLMREIADAPECVSPPAEASAGLGKVIEGLLTRDPAARLTLNQMRHHEWLTAYTDVGRTAATATTSAAVVDAFGSRLRRAGRAKLPDQPVANLDRATPQEIEQAFSNRQAIAYMSAAGPGTLGRDIGVVSDWERVGPNTIRKRTTKVHTRR